MTTKMTPEIYSDKIAGQILDKIHEKGWNLYHREDIDSIGRDNVIRQNLASKLEANVSYILLPVAEDPLDPEQVMGALEVLGQKLNREMPTMTVYGEKRPITGITLRESDVHVHTPEGTDVSYPLFMESLDSIVDTKNPK